MKAGAALGMATAIPWSTSVAVAHSPSLGKYETTMPIPDVREPDGKRKGADYYEIPMREVTQELHPDLGTTTVWGYDGQYPGQTIEVRRNERIKVKWINDLPTSHLLPVDDSIHGAEGNPEVRTVTHAHGLHVESASDGLPEAWFTQNYGETGEHFVKEVYDYDNRQPGATLWYHDHALGITRLNVYAGLAGFYVLRDGYDRRLDLPSGDYEVPILLQDRTFDENGELFYPDGSELEDSVGDGRDPSIVPESFGDTAVVNGKVWPTFEVEPRKYRFRFLNGSNSRFINPRLFEVDESDEPVDGGDVPVVYQIGTDLGFLEETFQPERIDLSPAERADVIVDFSGLKGQRFVLGDNTASAPFKGPGTKGQEVELSEFMRFDVTKDLRGEDTSSVPERPGRPDPSGKAQNTRDLPLIETTDKYGRLMNILNQRGWDEDTTENPQLGVTEVWNLVNTTEDTHPMHIHLVGFEVVERQPFDATAYLDDLEDEQDPTDDDLDPLEEYYTGDPKPPEQGERGRKDTVQAHPGEVTKIKARFGSYTGRYVWHCHILEHEDHEMMRPYEVVTGNNQSH